MNAEAGKETSTIDSKSLTIKISASSAKNSGKNKQVLANIVTSAKDSASKASLTNSLSSSPYNSPLISPPSSAFVSALQSPYISPRATNIITITNNQDPISNEDIDNSPTPATTLTHPSPPVSYCGSQSDDVPSTSYTPPPEQDSDDCSKNTKIKIVTCVPVSGQETGPRISFSFPIPRISFAKSSVQSPSSNAKLRSCDVYIGFQGQNPNLMRFCKWLKSELEVQGIACFVADRAKYSDNQSHVIADRVICSVSFGVVVVTSYWLCNHTTLEEIRFFAQKKNLIPLLFDTDANEISSLFNPHRDNKECQEALDGLMKCCDEYKLEANEGNWRSCISKAACILRSKLGRMSVAEKEIDVHVEFPYPRNKHFVGRDREISDIESSFFGNGDYCEAQECAVLKIKDGTTEHSEGLADGESETDRLKSAKYVNLDVSRCKEPKLEAWVEPPVCSNRAASLRRPKYKKSKSGKYKSFGSSSIVCISGSAGVGKTELALEFAYRYSQRYKMILWVGGEARYLRQNILNLSINLGLDVSADDETEKGRIRSFEEQESEAFKRVRRELFRDMPYLLIIDNLETERDWWEGKDLHDLIPRNTGGTHVIITTRLNKVMNYDTVRLQTLPSNDAMTLIRGRRKKDHPASELEILAKFDEKLGRSTFGLWVVGCLLSELAITPSALLEAVNQIRFDEHETSQFCCLSSADQQFCRTSPFLMKVLTFCDSVLQQRKNLLASRSLQVGAWFAPSPVSADLLAEAAKSMPTTRNKLGKWTECLKLITFPRCSCGYLSNQPWKSDEEESALLLVKLGLARRVNNKQSAPYIQFHPITQTFSKWKYGGGSASKSTVHGVRKLANPLSDSDHLWASAFLVFGFKTEPPIVQLKATEMVMFIRRTALPLALRAFATFSRCSSALELLKVCTNALEEAEKSFASQIQDRRRGGSLCWKKPAVVRCSDDDDDGGRSVDEYVWQEVTLLKATLLETRAKLMSRGGLFDSGEELCRTCVSIRTVMLGHSHAQTLAAQETLARLVRMRTKII